MENGNRCKKMVAFRLLLAGMLMFGLIIGIAGCNDSDDDDRTIEVCNGDNEEYVVMLHRYSDDGVIDQMHLEKWYDSDRCDSFGDPPEGRYYLTIHYNDTSAIVDKSDDFYLDDDDYHTFRIDSTGSFVD